MAHVKVVRRSMDKVEWILLRSSWLSKRIFKDIVPIEGWKIKEGRQVEEMEYEFFDEDYRDIKKGETYFSPDGTVFLKSNLTIPENLTDKEVWFQFKTAAEMMVKINGYWAGGLDPNRDRILLKEAENKNRNYEFFIEGYNRSKPDDERNPTTSFLRGCRQEFYGGELIVLDKEIEAASYDLKILIEAMNCEYINEDLRTLIKNELDIALNFVEYEELDESRYKDGVLKLRDYIEEKIFANNSYGKNGKVALVAHSHLDIAYYWRKIHTVQKNARTCLIQLRLMDKYPDFKYCHTQAYTYEMLEKYYPDIFEEVKKRVKEGRFEITGGMYVEPDCNIPNAESLIRQCMYGQHYFQEKFGVIVENCWLPDVFGNSWILPQILKKSRMNYFVSNKMSTWNDTNRFPHNNFIWKGIDGSEVYACVPPTHFISWNTPEQIIENWESFQDKEACDETLNMFGYGDGGSGVTEEMIEFMNRLEKMPGVPEVRHIRGDEFLEQNLKGNEKLEVWDGELYLEMHRGTFTTKANLKKFNRELEVGLRDLEIFATYASINGFDYPKERIDSCWKKILVNQFHDILPGTHIPPVERDAVKDYSQVAIEIEKLFDEIFKFLNIKKYEDEKKINLINTLGWKRKGPEFIKGDFNNDIALLQVDSQPGSKKGENGIWISVDSIEGLSQTSFDIIQKNQEKNKKWFSYEDKILETPYYKATLEKDGTISSLYDKMRKRELVQKGLKLNELKIYRDNPGMYDAWDIIQGYKDREDLIGIERELELLEAGDVYVAFKVKLKLKQSKWTTILRFYKSEARVDFEYLVDWQEDHRLAKSEFNFNILSRQAKCDTSAGVIVRDTHKNTTWQQARFEVCTHKWIDISEPGLGIAILNDGKYGVSFEKNNVGISLLRSPIRPDMYSDRGYHTMLISLIPHDGYIEETDIIEKSWALNTPLIAIAPNEINMNFIKIESNNLNIQAIKYPQNKSNDAKRMIVRIAELKGKRGEGIIKIDYPIKKVIKVNLLEEEEENQNIEVSEKEIKFDYTPFEINTFEIELKDY